MAIFKCKMCGGTLEITGGETVATCEYCGTKQTLPKTDDDVISALFNRANNLRLKCEFDKAAQIYEKIVEQDNTQAEAYWGIVLCKYGIEYVEDPKTLSRIPTCHRTLFEAVTADAEYLAAIEHADSAQRAIYEAEARAIDVLQKDILAIVKNEKPFDVFLCYKETDEYGKRTVDSAIANDIYHQLTQEGFKVFYAAITLEDKLGTAYEPYIFAALNSAKVMLVLGTKPEYFTAVWVKNEWSRFLHLMKTDRSKLLIPCYREMDAYDLPEEFAHLQAQDMGKIGFINDVVRGIKKVTQTSAPAPTVVKETVVTGGNTNVAPLLKRAFMFLEDGEWDRADEFCEQVLNIDPECADAYLGKLMAELRVTKQEKLQDCEEPFDDCGNYQKVLRFADAELAAFLNDTTEQIKRRNYEDLMNKTYSEARVQMERQGTLLNRLEYLEQAERLFRSLGDWKDAELQVANCLSQKDEIEKQLRAEEIAEKKREKRRIKIVTISFLSIIAVTIAVLALLHLWILPMRAYNNAEELLASGDYDGAAAAFVEAGDYNDASTRVLEVHYLHGKALLENGDYARAAICFGKAGSYKDARARSMALWDEIAARDIISAGNDYTVGLKADGTVVAIGTNYNGECDVDGWTDIVAVSSGYQHTIGLKADGTVVAVGDKDSGKCDIGKYHDIVEIHAGNSSTVLLKNDGTVISTGLTEDTSDWSDIVAISIAKEHTVGLKADGTVVAVGSNYDGQCDVSDWRDIVAISASNYHTVGLKADGTVVAVGYDDDGRCDVSDWRDIVAISAGYYHTVGLKSDGTVVSVGNNYTGQCDVSDWRDIVAISAGNSHTVGLKSDGTVVAVGHNYQGQCDVDDWVLKVPDTQ
ncbi:MAG: TIR domain-containing protein [Clostridia bacterium]|nr:TIR domain-containing protein [Clostridia bacterium]